MVTRIVLAAFLFVALGAPSLFADGSVPAPPSCCPDCICGPR